ncbi:hypothetical protein [Limobrevibacterium gyesilva]|uniref:Lipoprotein n=1 Tax=Limobrevibacterium gyesilva TaxID=2991712 RepID=A0AA41YQI1_9PROT|nr:hypothetical protein [Limobrevibacterium gyesilva]MCW3474773.1 hypothetical protein [Limobrevibacterium gyesilva]
MQKHRLLLAAFALTGMLTACSPRPPPAPPPPSGTVELNPGSEFDVVGGGGGAGIFFLNGGRYRFTIDGVGPQGADIAVLQTKGEVHRLADIQRFPGTYRVAPAGDVPAGAQAGGLWLENGHGTLLHLLTPSGGRMPPLGTDAVSILMQ